MLTRKISLYQVAFIFGYFAHVNYVLATNLPDCITEHLALIYEGNMDACEDFSIDKNLWSVNVAGPYPTAAMAHLHMDNAINCTAKIYFDYNQHPPQQAGLDYTVYAIELEVGDKTNTNSYFYSFNDFTENCTNPGISFFPGDRYPANTEIPMSILIKNMTKTLPFKLRIWGR